MRRTLAVLALLLAAALIWIASEGGPRGDKSPAAAGPETRAPAQASHQLEAPAGETAGSERKVQPPEPSELPAATARDEEVDLHGSVVATDWNGLEHPREDGELRLVLWKGKSPSGKRVMVRGGAWSARVPRDVRLGMSLAILGGRQAVLESEISGPKMRLEIPADGVVDLRVRWFHEMRLLVRDRDSNQDLTDVTLVRAEDWPRMDYPNPGDFDRARVLVRSSPSPVRIPADAPQILLLHVGAAGHAWEPVRLDAVRDEDRTVVLGPGGDLDLELVAERIDAGTVVRVRQAPRGVVADLDVRDRRALAIEGLPVGTLDVSAELGDPWNQPIVLAKSPVEIRAGERAHVVLDLAPPPAEASAALGGELVIPEEWGVKDFLLVIHLLDTPLGGREKILRLAPGDMRADAERAGVWHWRREKMQVARYELEAYPFYTSISLQLPKEGREDVRLEVPNPGEGSVRVVDAHSGSEATVSLVCWNARRPEWVQGGGCRRAEWDADARRWKLRAPLGEIELHAQGGEYKDLDQVVVLREGRNEFLLEVQRRYVVRLKLAQAGNRVLWPKPVEVEVRPAEGAESRRVEAAGGSPTLEIELDRPGTWIVALPEIPGYGRVPPFEVRVDPEHATEQTIELAPN